MFSDKKDKNMAPGDTADSASRFSRKKLVIIFAILVVALLVVGGGGYYYYRFYVAESNSQNQTDTIQKKVDESGPISWQEPEKISSLNLYTEPTTAELKGGTYRSVKDREVESKYYKVGTVKQGQYANSDILLMFGTNNYNGPGQDEITFLRFLRLSDGELVLLSKYSDKIDKDFRLISSKYTFDENFDISGMNFPSSLRDDANDQTFTRDTEAKGLWNESNLRLAFTHPQWGAVYTTKSEKDPSAEGIITTIYDKNGYYIKAPDGTGVTYSLSLSFVVSNTVPAVTFNDGYSGGDYNYTDLTGCGAYNYLSVPGKVTLADLKVVGKNKWNEPIYELKNTDHALLKEQYKKYSETFYSEDGGKVVSYKVFLENHPIFFWQTPYDQLVKFHNASYAMATECGKPVIYLYPEKPMQVSVKVNPVGGMTYSDPDYGSGWNVYTDTLSNIRDMITGRNYPYLFWEGRGGIYDQPKQGFVVAKKDVHDFLTSKLSLYGLNSKEIADFQEFWEPRMKKSPYYFVTFLDTKAMDALAPLTINPKPDTVIRVLMDYSELEKPIEVQEYKIKTPTRDGFTVVEWGGVLREWR